MSRKDVESSESSVVSISARPLFPRVVATV